jgi:hypothetical protein
MRPAHDPMKAIAWMAAALASFLVMAISVRELSAGMHPFQMLFIRSAIGVGILAAVLSAKGWGRLRTRRLGGHLARNLVHFAASRCCRWRRWRRSSSPPRSGASSWRCCSWASA